MKPKHEIFKIPIGDDTKIRSCYIFEISPIMCNNSSICLLFPHKKKKFLQIETSFIGASRTQLCEAEQFTAFSICNLQSLGTFLEQRMRKEVWRKRLEHRQSNHLACKLIYIASQLA
ncbi:hypothetical protein QLX08_006604 [Tetragonisca angustula]|uniref:Uncharacterized protein n=1 Tax=Tetragonisca angustula TaxID=166442 RepID=A0AAW0ZTT4_9HYME